MISEIALGLKLARQVQLVTGITSGDPYMVQMLTRDLGPYPAAAGERAVRILSKSLYRELRQNGYTQKQIVSVASELISLVTLEMKEEDRAE